MPKYFPPFVLRTIELFALTKFCERLQEYIVFCCCWQLSAPSANLNNIIRMLNSKKKSPNKINEISSKNLKVGNDILL